MKMKLPGLRLLSSDAKVLLPGASEVFDIAYAMYVVDDKDSENTIGRDVSRKIVNDFLSIRVEPLTVEDAYLRSVQGIANSHARALARCKRAFIKDHVAALNEKELRQQRLKDSSKGTDELHALWRLLSPALLGVVGFLTGEIISLIVPAKIATMTGTTWPSIAMSLLFVLVGRKVNRWYALNQQGIIDYEYEVRRRDIDLHYELSKLEEYKLSRARLSEAWEEYTEEKLAETVSYQMMMELNVKVSQKAAREALRMNRSALWKLKRILRIVRRRKSQPHAVVVEAT